MRSSKVNQSLRYRCTVNLFWWGMVQDNEPEPNDTMRKDLTLLPFRVAVALIFIASAASGQLRREAASAITDGEFWQIFSKMSETGGSIPSAHFVSNEGSFQRSEERRVGKECR